MSERMRKHLDVLRVLEKAPTKLRNAIIRNGDADLIYAICEVIVNVLNSTVPLNAKQAKLLRKYKQTLRNIASLKTSVGRKRQLIIQRGGFLPALIGSALGALISLLV